MLLNLHIPAINATSGISLYSKFIVGQDTTCSERIAIFDTPCCDDSVTPYISLSFISLLADRSSTKPAVNIPFSLKGRFWLMWISYNHLITPIYTKLNTLLGAAASYDFYSYSARNKGNWSEFIEKRLQ